MYNVKTKNTNQNLMLVLFEIFVDYRQNKYEVFRLIKMDRNHQMDNMLKLRLNYYILNKITTTK